MNLQNEFAKQWLWERCQHNEYLRAWIARTAERTQNALAGLLSEYGRFCKPTKAVFLVCIEYKLFEHTYYKEIVSNLLELNKTIVSERLQLSIKEAKNFEFIGFKIVKEIGV